MTKILRTPTRAEGGITPEEKVKLDAIAEKWKKIALRTDPIDKEKIEPAIKALYKAAGLKEPRVVIVPSPFVGRLASGIAAAVWYLRKNGKSAATYAATDDATDDATYDATRDATDDATSGAKEKSWLMGIVEKFTPGSAKFTLDCISLSYRFYQGGNMWAYFGAYAESMRDVIGLTGLDCWDKYQPWGEASKEGGFRYMHEEFCIVSDFPEVLSVNDQNQAHNSKGPSHRWRDGFQIYHLNGVRFDKEMYWKVVADHEDIYLDIPAEWKLAPQDKAAFILSIKDVDQRTQAMRFLEPKKLIDALKGEAIDSYTKIA